GEPGLARAARAGEGHQPALRRAQPLTKTLELRLAAEEAGELKRELARRGRRRARWRRCSFSPGLHALGATAPCRRSPGPRPLQQRAGLGSRLDACFCGQELLQLGVLAPGGLALAGSHQQADVESMALFAQPVGRDRPTSPRDRFALLFLLSQKRRQIT